MTYKIGQEIEVMYFGTPEKMIISEYDEKDKQWKCVWPEGKGYGSSWYSESDLQDHERRVDRHRNYRGYNREFQEDTDGCGNCYSDADPGL